MNADNLHPRAGTRTRWLLLGLLALAAAVRVYWGTRQRVVWGDEPYYLWLGQSLLRGEGYQFFGISGAHFSPLFPLLAGLIGQVGGGSSQALAAGSVALYVVCGTLFVLPIFAIARRLAGDAAGWAAGLVVALYPVLTTGLPLWGTMTEPLYLLLIAVAWWALLVALEEGRWWGYAVAGAALALAYLTRTEALAYLVAGLGAVFLIELLIPDRAMGGTVGRSAPAAGPSDRPSAAPARAIESPGRSPTEPARRAARVKHTLAGIALALAVFALVISPYLIALRVKTGQWQLAEEAGSTYVSAAGLARGDVAAFDRATWGLDAASGQVYLFAPASESQGLLSAIAADPRGFIRRVRSNLNDLFATTFSSLMIPLALAALAMLGLFARPWDTRRLRGELLLITSLVGPLSFLPFFIQSRYLVGVLIPAAVWIGAGVAWVGEWSIVTWGLLRARGQGSGGVEEQESGSAEKGGGVPAHRLLNATPAVLLALALLWLQPRMWASSQHTRSFQPGHLAAAAELQAQGVTAETVVMSRYPAIAFHAGTRWAPTPAASWPEIEAYARRHEARYLVVDQWETELRPQLRALLDPAQTPPALEYVATIDRGAGPVVLYRFR
jgi:hypothetical protein